MIDSIKEIVALLALITASIAVLAKPLINEYQRKFGSRNGSVKKPNGADKDEGKEIPPIDDRDPVVEIDLELLHSYRVVIANSTTTMTFLDYLMTHSDALEETLTIEVASTIQNHPTRELVRHILFSLCATYFLGIRNSNRIFLTTTGKRAYKPELFTHPRARVNRVTPKCLKTL